MLSQLRHVITNPLILSKPFIQKIIRACQGRIPSVSINFPVGSMHSKGFLVIAFEGFSGGVIPPVQWLHDAPCFSNSG